MDNHKTNIDKPIPLFMLNMYMTGIENFNSQTMRVKILCHFYYLICNGCKDVVFALFAKHWKNPYID